MTDHQEIEKIFEAIQNILKLRNAKGYGANHPIKPKSVKPPLGKSDYDLEKTEKLINSEPVEVSKVYTKEKKDEAE